MSDGACDAATTGASLVRAADWRHVGSTARSADDSAARIRGSELPRIGEEAVLLADLRRRGAAREVLRDDAIARRVRQLPGKPADADRHQSLRRLERVGLVRSPSPAS